MANPTPINENRMRHYKIVKALTELLDNKFEVFGIRFGIDPVLGLIPGIGDVISVALSIYTVIIARQMNIPGTALNRMLFNIILDFAIGIIPVAGDFSDFFFKANQKNMNILKSYVEVV